MNGGEKTHEQLKAELNQYRLLVENQTDLIVKVDNLGRFEYVSPSYCALFGKTKEELMGKNFVPLIHEDDKELTEREMKNLYNPPYCCWVEQRALTAQGWRWIGWADKAVLDEKNEVVGIVAIGRDVTERKKTEQLAIRLGRILENSFNEIYAFEAHTLKFIYVNQGALNNLGYTHEEMLKLTPYDIKSDLDKSEFVSLLKPLFNENRTIQVFESIHRRKDGTTYPVEVRLQLSHSEYPPVFFAIVQDITERKWAQTSKLESIGVLAGGIAHDFNNILTGITGNLSLAKIKIKANQKDATDIERLLWEAEKAAMQAKSLTQQLLTFAKGGEPVFQIISIKEFLVESVSFAMRGSNVMPVYQFAADLWSAKMDPGQVNQVIQNIIINACQAMPQGGNITIKAENFVSDGGGNSNVPHVKKQEYVKISIKDNGTGIPEEVIYNIFDPYFTTKPKGSGLGLAISHSIVKKHGGFIEVESECGAGSEFHVYLPAYIESKIIKSNEIKGYPTGNGSVLFMDDEKILREVVAEMIRYLGYTVSCARDGQEAIELYVKARESGDPFCAVIMDLTIAGGMGGQEAIGILMQIDPEVKAIVASGYSNDPVMSNCRDYGFTAVLAKPFSIEELGRVLQSVVPKYERGTVA